MRALVTGATGFIGSNLVSKLLEERWEVHIIVRKTSNIDKFRDRNQVTIHVYNQDIDINNIVAIAKPDIVFNLASYVLGEHRYDDIQKLIESNIIFGTQLVDSMVKNNVRCLVNSGTFWQNYNNEDYNPVNLYAATKEAFEKILYYYQDAFGLKVINLKLFDTYGVDDTRNKLLPLLNKTMLNDDVLLMSEGRQQIDIVYVDDVVNAFLQAADYLVKEKYEYCGTYSVASLNQIELKSFVDKYEKVVGKKLNIKWGGRPYRQREVMIPWNRGTTLPGWSAKVSLEEGIMRILESIKSQQGGRK